MYNYTAYGIGICSEFELPETTLGNSHVDVTVRLGRVDPSAKFADQPYWFVSDDNGARLHWDGVGTYLVRNGCEIVMDLDPAVTPERMRLFLLNATMAVLLHQRGQMVFHGSAVMIGGHAVTFLAEKGWGKSTMAASLNKRGHQLISDDVLGLAKEGDKLMVQSAFPQLKLWPDSLALIGRDSNEHPKLHPDFDKRSLQLQSGFVNEPVPLHHVFLLGYGEAAAIEPLRASQAVVELLPHWYCARFGPDMLEDLGRAEHFKQCAELVNRVPVSRLKRPPSLARLPEVLQLLEEACFTESGSSGELTYAK